MKHLIISRTDNLGDVVLTLPLAGFIKHLYPDIIISFIGKKYTRPVVERCIHINQFYDREDLLTNPSLMKSTYADVILMVFPDKEIVKLAKDSGIALRIGTSHRWFHWLYCNKRIDFSRKKSDLHEAQLNFKLLAPLGVDKVPSVQELGGYYGLKADKTTYAYWLDRSRYNIIFHPKSKGSAREWPIEYYYDLIQKLPSQEYKIFITGTESEGKRIKKEKPELLLQPNVQDLTGKFSLEELIEFIGSVDGLLACSTGPLHIAAALGVRAWGIFPPIQPMHPGRWAPIGSQSKVFALEKACSDCRKSGVCACIQAISVDQITSAINADLPVRE